MPHKEGYGEKGPGVVIALGALKKRRDNPGEEMPDGMESEGGVMEKYAELEARIAAIEAKLGGSDEE